MCKRKKKATHIHAAIFHIHCYIIRRYPSKRWKCWMNMIFLGKPPKKNWNKFSSVFFLLLFIFSSHLFILMLAELHLVTRIVVVVVLVLLSSATLRKVLSSPIMLIVRGHLKMSIFGVWFFWNTLTFFVRYLFNINDGKWWKIKQHPKQN